MSSEPRGQMVPMKTHYDPKTVPYDPSYDPKYTARAHVTGRTDNPQPRKEN